MSDPQLNNYIYQNLFALNESLKKDSSSKNIRAALAQNKVLGNMIRQEAVDIALCDRHIKSKLLPYLPNMFEKSKMELDNMESKEINYNNFELGDLEVAEEDSVKI